MAVRFDKGGRAIPVDDLAGTQTDLVLIGGAANGRFDDLRVCTEILKGKKVNDNTRLIVMPASRTVYLEALKKGILRVLVEAGAVIMAPGSWPVTMTEANVTDSAMALTTVSLHSHMENINGKVILVSPATAAASAITGQITNPSGYVKL
jgi:3-isopropylmalate/(R)-2-methylmalate dehydratase large subunit